MQRSAPRLTRILAAAAVPVMLVVAGCSSDSGSGGGDAAGDSGAARGEATASASATPSPKPTPTVEPAKYAKLPTACKAIAAKTSAALVPKAKSPNGTAAASSDLSHRAGCSWNGLEDKGVKGSQYRWLDVSFYRYDSEVSLGSGQARAQENFAKEVGKIQATTGAKTLSTAAAPGIGDEAKLVTYTVNKTDEDFPYASVVARTGNVVVVLSYNGAGYAGAPVPRAKTIVEGATQAAKEAVASVVAANK
ncbi:DUF3558 domain-containing protein [Streptomyces omiyaensis]|uniref:DUF3558 domain-containing protein n=1 Tax=Streptomyces omiyaensis TaxID=68247 RepID=A0ABW7BZ18_9ACTN|nr:DUF3558 domain-containing protein [Streptomyces omiyaensis]GGY68887.1 hypothetical protein GCM10010363_57620 [Streptomyces omiyaensis]